MRTRRKRTLLGVVGLIAVLLAGAAGIWTGQRRLIYYPDVTTPQLDLRGWMEVSYPTSDGLELTGWYRSPEAGSPLVIVFNGNAGNRGDRVSLGRALDAAGYGVLLTDYRGYGGNEGHPSEQGLALDARAALVFAGDRAPESPTVYFGESLGAAVAVELASDHPPAALVLRSPFTSLAAMSRYHYPWLPVGPLLRDRYPSYERMGSVLAPTLVIGGEADSIVPLEQSQRVFAAAPDPKRLLVIAGADHNDAELVHGADLIDVVTRFVTEVLES